MDVAGPQFGGEAVALTIEQQKRMVTGGPEMAVVGALLLLALDRDFSTVHIEHDAPRPSDSFDTGD